MQFEHMQKHSSIWWFCTTKPNEALQKEILQIVLDFCIVMSVLYNIYCCGLSFVFLTPFVSWHAIIICSNHSLNLSYCRFLVKYYVLHTTLIFIKSMIEAERGLFRPLNWGMKKTRKRRSQFQENSVSKGMC